MTLNIQEGGITGSWKSVPDSTWKNKGNNNFIGSLSLGLLTTNNLINAISNGEISPGSKISGSFGWRNFDSNRKFAVIIVYCKASYAYTSNKLFQKDNGFDSQIITENFHQYDISGNLSTIVKNIGDIGLGFGFRKTSNIDNLPTITISDNKLINYDSTSNTYRFGIESQEVKAGDYKTFNDNFYINLDYYLALKFGIGIYLYERNYNSYSGDDNANRLRFNSSGIGLYNIKDPINAEHNVSFGITLETNPYVNFNDIKIKNCLINFIGGLSL